MTIPEKKPATIGAVMQDVLMRGDLSGLTPEQRVVYHDKVCESLELNPLTRPFEFIEYQGKLVMYPTRGCADQLRKRDYIDIQIVSQELRDGNLTVHVRAKNAEGRQDEDIGVVALPDNLLPNVRANRTMAAVTKAKRRVTLSLAGLGLPDRDDDETPLVREAPKIAPNVLLHDPTQSAAEGAGNAPPDAADAPAHDRPPAASAGGSTVAGPPADAARSQVNRENVIAASEAAPSLHTGGGAAGTVTKTTTDLSNATMDEADAHLAKAAATGSMMQLEKAWRELTDEQRRILEVAKNRRHKPMVLAVAAKREGK